MEIIKRVARKIKSEHMKKSYLNLIDYNAWMQHHDRYIFWLGAKEG